MNREEQLQAIVAKLVGDPHVRLPKPAQLDEPWRTIFLDVHRAGSKYEAVQLLNAAVSRAGGAANLSNSETYDEIARLMPDTDAFSAYPSEYEKNAYLDSAEWLWPGWIPLGVVTFLGAVPGMGKSLVALDLARRLIHRLPFPDGAPTPDFDSFEWTGPSRRVLLVDAEGAPDIFRRRVAAWEIDTRRLFQMDTKSGRIDLDAPPQRKLLWAMADNLEPSLIIVDSLAASSAGGETSVRGARDLLGFLAALATDSGAAILVIHHLRKRGSSGRTHAVRPAADDLRGSSHLSAAAKSVLALSLGVTPSGGLDYNGPRRLEVVKTNLCRYPPPLSLTIEGNGTAVPTLRYAPWVDQPSAPTSQADFCARWLLDYLAAAGQPVRPHDVVLAAHEEGFPRDTVYRARHLLGVAVQDVGSSAHDPSKRWLLAPPSGAPKVSGGEDTPSDSHTVIQSDS